MLVAATSHKQSAKFIFEYCVASKIWGQVV